MEKSSAFFTLYRKDRRWHCAELKIARTKAGMTNKRLPVYRKSFFDILFVFMVIVMEGNELAVIFVNSRCGYNRATEIAADIFGDGIGVAKIGFGINIKAVPAVLIAKSFHFFKRGTKLLMK